jgi:hypothetical protein
MTNNLHPIFKRMGHVVRLDVKPVLHLVPVPFVFLVVRDLQTRALLLPLRHESAAAILGDKLYPIYLHLLWLSLQFIVFAKCVHIWLSTVRFTSPTKLTQSKKPIGSQMTDL